MDAHTEYFRKVKDDMTSLYKQTGTISDSYEEAIKVILKRVGNGHIIFWSTMRVKNKKTH